MIKSFLRKILFHLRGYETTEELIKRGMTVGSGFKRMAHVMIDPGHSWLITIGDNVTLAPRVHLLAHDASSQAWRKVTRIGRVVIGNNVFVGADTVVLPGVSIGDNVVVGAGSVVSRDIPSNSLAVGCPARVISNIDVYLSKVDAVNMKFDESYLFPNITSQKKAEMNAYLEKYKYALLVRKK